MRATAGLMAALVLAGGAGAACSTVAPMPSATPHIATDMGQMIDGNTNASIYRFTPWLFSTATVFLCVDDPGPGFTATQPVPDPAAGCVRLPTTPLPGSVRATLDPARVPPSSLAMLAKGGNDYVLAIAGSQGSETFVRTWDVERPGALDPLPEESDAGPS